MKEKVSVFWFRRDLRLEDNAGLHYALSSGFPVLPIFIFDPKILVQFEDSKDRRVDYIHQVLVQMNTKLASIGSRLHTFYEEVDTVFDYLLDNYDVQFVFCNRDYEPTAIARDTKVYIALQQKQIPFKAYKDQVIFDKKEIIKANGSPYVVYTAFSKQWKNNLKSSDYQSFDNGLGEFVKADFKEIHSLQAIGFEITDVVFNPPVLDVSLIADYDKYRDYPAMQRTTVLGIALRFGTISIRKCVAFALIHNLVWLSELIWHDFFMYILYHFPEVEKQSFHKKYDVIPWRNNEQEFELWCKGETGYPIVDAGMRQLNETGYMHNRVRMIVASFLCKHLLIDWRWGEAYFAQKLNDYDLAANNGNWQWVAGTGCDAAPYFRIFNPMLQTAKFDPKLEYIKRWVPEYSSENYAKPIVDHAFARERTLKAYATINN